MKEDQHKKIRLFVKRRLAQQFSDALSEFQNEPEKRKKQLDELYKEFERQYQSVIKRLNMQDKL
jgi:hypothetical protein